MYSNNAMNNYETVLSWGNERKNIFHGQRNGQCTESSFEQFKEAILNTSSNVDHGYIFLPKIRNMVLVHQCEWV